ncbi:flavin reductase (DIM6/NTAB) family NADH-FMN oxidoreductase RutF [Microvirga flocculans]|uniref:Flavin reductase (DIM6/NTAB) family NADH-FMN oxidoreductase RutF n=1 Tax=Microvirga flocculans TaxID=217168 RepID=A0A7W6N6L7_9HYPH|nr:flavin reductase family protein [Microvirga flocculans]MBB4038448.1 flavin reductase (DIM6/NTAB) family NADH-FMN oxidoreductase RutF [Microvirga flocculans]
MTGSSRVEWKPAPSFAEVSDFRLAMREVAGAVTIVTAGKGEDRRGLTVTALCSLSTDPPSLIVCVNKSSEGHKMIQRYGSFCVNVVAGDHGERADRFAGRTGLRGEDRFAAEHWTTLATGAPVMADAIAVLDCDVIDALDRGTHTIFIGGVRAVQCEPNRPALVYRAGQYQVVHDKPSLPEFA